MNKLIMLRGLPASGKSTHAYELVAQGYKRVNKDDLRAMVDHNKWSKTNEMYIKYLEMDIAKRYLNASYNVVVDDTNFIYEDFWKKISDECGAEFEVKDFDTHPTECVKRDLARGEKSVGSKVIWDMYNKYIKPKPPKYNKELEDVYIFDIDGTLALMQDRNPHDYDRVSEDYLNENIANILDTLPTRIIILSGRPDSCKFDTEAWLDKNGIKYAELHMRKTGDTRKDYTVKEEIYNNHIKDKYNVLGVFDDRDQVVQMWRSKGLTCLQVNYGDF